MDWILEGQEVSGTYHNQRFEGRVTESRVAYGGRVLHTVELTYPIELPWGSEPRTRIIVKDSEIELA